MYWYSKAAAKDRAKAHYNLGICYEERKGLPKDLDEANRLYQLAADQGNAAAIASLATKFREGLDADLHESNKLLCKPKKVAAAGTDDAIKQAA